MNKLLPRRWQKQPQTPVEIDWSHPLAKGLTGLWIFNTAFPLNLVTGEKSTSVNIPSYSADKIGKAYQPVSMQLCDNITKLMPVDRGTLFVSALQRNTDSASFTQYVGASNDTSLGMNFLANNGTNGTLYFSIANSGFSSLVTSIGKQNSFDLLFNFGDGTIRGFNKGVFLSSVASTRNRPTSTLPFTAQTAITGAVAGNKHLKVVATWNRKLTDKESAEASRNIYQLLKPTQQLKLTPLVIELSLDVDLPFPAPIFDAEMAVVEENQILFDLDLTTSAPDLSAGFLKGEIFPLNLPAPSLDIFLDIGQVNRFSMALPMPSVGINMTMDTGILIPISLPLPVPEIESDLVAGQLLNLNLDLPVFDISLGFGEGFAFDVPAPTLEADIRVGNVVSFGLDMPTPNLAIELATERALNIEMPMPAFNLEMAFITGNVVEFSLDMPAPPFSATVLNGLSMDIALDTSIPDLQAQFGLDGYIDFAFAIPAPMLQADFSSNITSATGRFFNRWTR